MNVPTTLKRDVGGEILAARLDIVAMRRIHGMAQGISRLHS